MAGFAARQSLLQTTVSGSVQRRDLETVGFNDPGCIEEIGECSMLNATHFLLLVSLALNHGFTGCADKSGRLNVARACFLATYVPTLAPHS